MSREIVTRLRRLNRSKTERREPGESKKEERIVYA